MSSADEDPVGGEIVKSTEYLSFRSSVPQKRVIVDEDDNKVWTMYDAGPKTVRCPLICLPPVSGTADVFFRQMLALSALGYRVISLEYPIYWNIREWCEGFRRLIDHLKLDKIHLFGASLGGFLALKFCEMTHMNSQVHSLILCNSFIDTTVFRHTTTAGSFWLMPAFMLKKMIMGNFSRGTTDTELMKAVEFMTQRLETINQQELASRLTLNCNDSYVEPQNILSLPITLIDVFDDCAISQPVRDEMYKCFPHAKKAHLKSGGNFPYLSRTLETNLHVQIHLRQFNDSCYSAMDPSYIQTQLNLTPDTDSEDEDDKFTSASSYQSARQRATDNE